MLPSVSPSTKQPLQAAKAVRRVDGFGPPVKARKTAATPAATKLHKKQQSSKTLMRTSVKKPVVAQKTTKKPAATASKLARPAAKPIIAPSVPAPAPERFERAQQTPKSALISRFGQAVQNIRTDIIPVKPAPKAAEIGAVAAAFTAAPEEPKDIFQAAIDAAKSHEQQKHKKRHVHHRVAHKLRISPVSVLVLSFGFVALVAGSIYAYTNVPDVAVKVASVRSGVDASLPEYQPAGYSIASPISYNSGEITLQYKSNSDDRNFEVTQRNSSWNSETLRENFISSNDKTYQTLQQNGRTIYIYDGTNATWVDGGVWYDIKGKTSLNSDQLLRIADSLR